MSKYMLTLTLSDEQQKELEELADKKDLSARGLIDSLVGNYCGEMLSDFDSEAQLQTKCEETELDTNEEQMNYIMSCCSNADAESGLLFDHRASLIVVLEQLTKELGGKPSLPLQALYDLAQAIEDAKLAATSNK